MARFVGLALYGVPGRFFGFAVASAGTADVAVTAEAIGSIGVTEATGGWSFLSAYERELQSRRAQAIKRKEREEETNQIQDDLDRNIAQLLREQEAIDDRRSELDRLQGLAKQSQDIEAAKRYSERVAKAYMRALEQGNFSALEAFDRELTKAQEEEDFLLLAMTLILDN